MFTGKPKTSLCVCLLEQGDLVAAERLPVVVFLVTVGPTVLIVLGLFTTFSHDHPLASSCMELQTEGDCWSF